MEIEWDTRKAQSNIRKHGVTFEEAATALWDPFAATAYDPEHSKGEERYITFGLSDRNRLLVVTHADYYVLTRIISARVATKKERLAYEKG